MGQSRKVNVYFDCYIQTGCLNKRSFKTLPHYHSCCREAFIETPDHVKALSEIHSLENAHLADEILRYIEHQGPLGAPGPELKVRSL